MEKKGLKGKNQNTENLKESHFYNVHTSIYYKNWKESFFQVLCKCEHMFKVPLLGINLCNIKDI